MSHPKVQGLGGDCALVCRGSPPSCQPSHGASYADIIQVDAEDAPS